MVLQEEVRFFTLLAGLIDQLQRELYLPRVASRFADNAKPASPYDIRRQAEIDNIKDVEELRTELDRSEVAISPMTKVRIFHQRDIHVVESRTSKRVPSEGTKTAVIWARASHYANRNVEIR